MNPARCLLSIIFMVALCSCQSPQPNDMLQSIASGDIFAGTPLTPAEKQALEDKARANHDADQHTSKQRETLLINDDPDSGALLKFSF